MEEGTTIEILEILKALTGKVKDLERQVKDSDMASIKGGYVKGPRPSAKTNTGMPNGDTISKMDWKDLDSLVQNLGGNV